MTYLNDIGSAIVRMTGESCLHECARYTGFEWNARLYAKVVAGRYHVFISIVYQQLSRKVERLYRPHQSFI